MSTSSYERRARCITNLKWKSFIFIQYLITVVTSKLKEVEKFSFFIWGVARILTGQEKLTKREHKLLRGPHNGAREEKILKIAFENCPGFWSLKRYWVHFKSKSGYNVQGNIRQGRGEGLLPLHTFYAVVYQDGTTIPFYKICSIE